MEDKARVAGATKQAVVASFYGTRVSATPTILPPAQSKNKGSGKRIKAGKEKAIKLQERRKRLCKMCNQLCHHDSVITNLII